MNKQNEAFKELCDTLQAAAYYDISEAYGEQERKVIAIQIIDDNFDNICAALRKSGFVFEFTKEELNKIFVPCIMCCYYCDKCQEWVETQGLTKFSACCMENLIDRGHIRKEETDDDNNDESTIEADPYKEIETYKKIIKDTLDDLYKELNYTTYAKLAERLRKSGLWK